MNTRRISLQTRTVAADSNASLWLDKFITGQDETLESKPKQTLIREVTGIGRPEIYKGFFDRWKDSLAAIGAKFRTFKVEGRMVVGLGAEGVLETSIALHRTYGVPFIAGSALKGLAARYADSNLQLPAWRKGNSAHDFVFGSQDSAGFITFHDALLDPETQYPLRPDIMTVHHSAYYGDNSIGPVAPADWDSPIPIPFLSATGTYLVAISCSSKTEEALNWIKFVFAILEAALREEGIGAKTSSGYGRGIFVKSKEDKAEELDKVRVEGFMRRVKALKNVAGEINTIYQEWKNLNASVSLRKVAALTIIDKVRETGREKQSRDKPWYLDLMQFVSGKP